MLPTLGVVIPCHKPYIVYLRECLDSIESQTVKPSKVMVLCSSSIPSDIPPEFSNYSFPLQVFTRNDIQNQAKNRNTGAMYIGTDLISFFDADDRMHPQRIETILKNADTADIILHSFTTNLYELTPIGYPTLYRNQLELAPSLCVHLIPDWKKPIHNAHVTIRKEVLNKVLFREDLIVHQREDALFCGDVMKIEGIQSLYISNPLSWYRLIH